MTKTQRFGISMPGDLLEAFDELIAKQGYANRSEAIRHIVRDFLIQRQWMMPEGQVVGTITIVYDHHARGLQSRLIELQHERLSFNTSMNISGGFAAAPTYTWTMTIVSRSW